MAENDQVPSEGGNQDQGNLGWRAALPDSFKNDDFVKTFTKPGDFVKAAMDIKTERDQLKARIDALPKAPEKAEGYVFEGDSTDEAEISWAREAFFKAQLSQDQVKLISAAYNARVKAVMDAETAKQQQIVEKGMADLKTEFGDKFDENIEMAKRVWKKHTNADLEEFVNRPRFTPLGNDPTLIRYVISMAKLTGEDKSPASSPPTGKSKEFNATDFYAAIAAKPA